MSAKRLALFKYGSSRQNGGVLLIMLVILVVGIAALLVSSLTSSSAKTARQKNTSAALAQAKDALIGFAVTYGDNPAHSLPQVDGYLPCPDPNGTAGLNGEGSSETCGSHDVSVIGRFPWKTLGLSALRDGDGECLWYAVSGTYKDNPKTTGLMNWDTDGQLQVYSSDGTQLASQVVAVIFAPGAPLSGQSQNRSPDGTAPICGGNYTVANYLDTGTVNSINFNNANIASGTFIQGTSGGSINDQMMFITRQDIWNAVQKRTDFQPRNPTNPALPNFNNPLIKLTQQVANCLVFYASQNDNCGGYCNNNSLPWPAPLVLSDYSANTQYNDQSNLYAGRVPYNVGTSSGFHNPLSTLMTTAVCPGGPGGWPSVDPWWNNWKDQLFYALSGEFAPQSGDTPPCGTCLKINGSGHYAAVVMFANSRLAGQVRASDTTGVNSAPRGTIGNYLESNNASNFTGANGNENYITAPVSSTFNDVLCTIDQNLLINCP
jgi:type II secretory pathway pseudopilin PulG